MRSPPSLNPASAGMSLAACADITLAAESASFRSAYSAIGLSPDCAASPSSTNRAVNVDFRWRAARGIGRIGA
jgi:hypothetical protein